MESADVEPRRSEDADLNAQWPHAGGREWIFGCLGIGLPLALFITWHLLNRHYPNDDSADYFQTAQRIFLFRSDGFLKGRLAYSYLRRGWRPIVFPLLAVPWLLLSKDNILFAVAANQIFFYALLLFYTYVFALQYLPAERAAVCPVFLGTLPWLFNFAQVFMSETPLMACGIATLFHMVQSRFLANRRQSLWLGFWMAFGIMVRPVEFCSSFLVLLVIFLAYAMKSRVIGARDVVVGVTLATTTTMLCLLEAFTKVPMRWIGILGFVAVVVSVLIFWNTSYLRLSAGFISWFIPMNAFTLIWWLPFSRELYSWLHTASGEMAKLYAPHRKLGLLQTFWGFFSNLGRAPLAIVFFMALAGAALRRDTARLFRMAVIVGTTMVILPILFQSLTNDTDYRRAYIGFAVLPLLLSIVALHPVTRRARLRFGGMIALSLFQATMAFTSTYRIPMPSVAMPLVSRLWGNVVAPFTKEDPSERFFRVLRSYRIGSSGPRQIAVFSLAMLNPDQRLFDPPALQYLSEKYRTNMTFGYPWDIPDLNAGYGVLRRDYDYVLLDVSRCAHPTDPYSRLAADMINCWYQHRLRRKGLQVIHKFEVDGRTILLLAVRGPGGHRLSPGENVALDSNGGVAGATVASEPRFGIHHLNDGLETTFWGSCETKEDTIFYVSRIVPYRAKVFRVVLFATEKGLHLRDVSVVATSDRVDGKEKWNLIRSRLGGLGPFREKITIPPSRDRMLVDIELDASDPRYKPYKTFGLACFSKSRGYRRNYLVFGDGIYVRELQIARLDRSADADIKSN